jgi:hypothetical protein
MASVHVGLRPLQAPLQRTNVHVFSGVASIVTVVPAGNEREHADPHAIPEGRLVTFPRPTFVTATGKLVPASTNEATAADAARATTAHDRATPWQEPDQPARIQPSAATACNVSRDPTGSNTPQTVPQEIPAGELTIDPLPVTLTAIGRRVGWTPPMAAVTARARITGTTQAPLPVHAPPQLTEPDGVRVTFTPAPNEATQASPQAIPGTSLVTVPPPAATATAYTVSGGANVAVTDRGSPILTEHDPVPVQAPVQPANDQPGVGAAISVTVLSVANEAVHVWPQSIPAGWLVTLPLPVTVTASGNCVGRARTNVAVISYVFPGSTGSMVHLSSPHGPNPSNADPGSAVALSVTGW